MSDTEASWCEGVTVTHARHEAQLLGLVRQNQLARQQQPRGSLGAHQCGQNVRGAHAGVDSERRESQPELGVRGSHSHVTRQSHAQASAHCRAVDGGDHRHGQLADAEETLVGSALVKT